MGRAWSETKTTSTCRAVCRASLRAQKRREAPAGAIARLRSESTLVALCAQRPPRLCRRRAARRGAVQERTTVSVFATGAQRGGGVQERTSRWLWLQRRRSGSRTRRVGWRLRAHTQCVSRGPSSALARLSRAQVARSMRQRKRGACVRTARLAVGARLRCGIGAVRSPCWGRAAFGGAEAPMASRNPVEPDLETCPAHSECRHRDRDRQ